MNIKNLSAIVFTLLFISILVLILVYSHRRLEPFRNRQEIFRGRKEDTRLRKAVGKLAGAGEIGTFRHILEWERDEGKREFLCGVLLSIGSEQAVRIAEDAINSDARKREKPYLVLADAEGLIKDFEEGDTAARLLLINLLFDPNIPENMIPVPEIRSDILNRFESLSTPAEKAYLLLHGGAGEAEYVYSPGDGEYAALAEARRLIAIGDKAALALAAGLLESSDMQVRRDAAVFLTEATGRVIGEPLYGGEKERRAACEGWKQFIAEGGD